MTADDTAALLAPYLDEDEPLLWTGRPRIGLRFRAADIVLAPFSLLFAGIALVYEYAAIRVRAPLIMHLWGLAFVLAGLYLLAGRFFWDALRRELTTYGVSTRRAIFLSGLWRRRVRLVPLDAIRGVSIREHADATGDVLLDANAWQFGWFGLSWPGLGFAPPLTFEAVADPQRAYAAIERASSTAGEGPAGDS
ncbi:MAG: hypothetical protein KGN76_12445 [Acidobacteriota bacterium]|nr:hypothetical protein [Acidobacteriota bacterium]